MQLALAAAQPDPFSGHLRFDLVEVHELADGHRIPWDSELMDLLGLCKAGITLAEASRPKPPKGPPEDQEDDGRAARRRRSSKR